MVPHAVPLLIAAVWWGVSGTGAVLGAEPVSKIVATLPKADPHHIGDLDRERAAVRKAEVLRTAQARLAKGEPIDLEAVNRELVELDQALYGEKSRRFAARLLKLARTLERIGKVDEARKNAATALVSYERLLGEDAADTISARWQVRELEAASKAGDEAIAEARQRLEHLLEMQKGTDHAATAKAVRDCIDHLRTTVYGRETPWVSDFWVTLAGAHESAGEYPQAIDAMRQALRVRAETVGRTHPETAEVARALDGIAVRGFRQGEDASPVWLKTRSDVLAWNRAAFGENDRRTVDARVLLTHAERLSEMTQAERQAFNMTESLAARLPGLKSAGQLRAGVATAKQLRAARTELFGREHHLTALASAQLGEFLFRSGSLSEAEAAFKQAISTYEVVYGTSHPQTARMCNELGSVYRERGEHDAAYEWFERSLRIHLTELGPQHALTGWSLRALASIHRLRLEYPAAEDLYLRGLHILSEVSGEEDAGFVRGLVGLGDMYREMGRMELAEALLRRAVSANRRVFGETSAEHVQALGALATLLSMRGELAEAKRHLSEADRLVNAGVRLPRTTQAALLTSLGTLELHLNDPASAARAFNRCLPLFGGFVGRDHRFYISTLVNLSTVEIVRRDYAGAEDYLTKAARLLDVSGLPDEQRRPLNIVIRSNLGLVLLQQRKITQAIETLKEVLTTAERDLGVDHRDTLRIRTSLANAYRDAGNDEAAEAEYMTVLSRLTETERERDLALARYLCGEFYLTRGDVEQAEPLLRDACEWMLEHVERTAVVTDERLQLATRSQLSEIVYAYLTCLVTQGGPDRSDAAYAVVLRWKGGTLLRTRAVRSLAANRSELRSLLAELQSITARLSRLVVTEGAGDLDEVVRLRDRREEIEAELNSQSAAFREARRAPTPAEITDLLAPDAVLVDCIECLVWDSDAEEYAAEIFAFVLKRGTPTQVVPLGRSAPIEEAVTRWHQTHGTGPDGRAAAATVAQLVWQPLGDSVQEAGTVVVCPDGVLSRFPFAALPIDKQGTYLVERSVVATLPAAALLRTGRESESTERSKLSALLVGDIDYGTGERSEWEQLPGTAAEIEDVRRVLTKGGNRSAARVRTFRGREATETNIRRAVADADMLHIATHGRFESAAGPASDIGLAEALRSNPLVRPVGRLLGVDLGLQAVSGPGLRAVLVFANANREPENPIDALDPSDDGLLTAEEIATLSLHRTRLAVLSACETSIGTRTEAEGEISLARSLHVAGCGSVVSSLWRVDDAATAALMRQFYEHHISAGLPPAEALRKAQLWMLAPENWNTPGAERGSTPDAPVDENGQPLGTRGRTSPAFWAAFIVSTPHIGSAD